MPRALVIAPNWIGDAVMTEPLLRNLQASGLEIDVLATPWVSAVYKLFPSVSEVIQADFQHGFLQFKQRLMIAKSLKLNKYDQAYILPNSFKSLLIPLFAKIPNIFGYSGELRNLFLTKSLPNPPKQQRPPMVEHYFNLSVLNPLNHQSHSLIHSHLPSLKIKEEDLLLARGLFKNLFPLSTELFLLAPGAEFGPAKQWPYLHFQEFAALLLSEYPNAGILIIGGPKDRAIGDRIIHHSHLSPMNSSSGSRIKNVCGEISLEQSFGLISIAQGLASNDSGIMHIGAALQIPQIAFFGSSDPKHTPPLSVFAKALWLGLECSPCHKRICPLGHLNCLNQITPESALIALVNLTSKKRISDV
ncbi:MAG: lipopolysaccharide heptosyltransferase II [Betaproteobacteria bacterium]